MAHEDQFTATGPAFTGAGFPRAAFSTGREGTDSIYGVNVQGSTCGVYGESVNTSPRTNRETPESRAKTGVCGIGDDYGVFGKGRSTAGVHGENDASGTGVFGVAQEVEGIGVAGISTVKNPSVKKTASSIGIVGATETGRGFGVVGLSVDSLTLTRPTTVPVVRDDGGNMALPNNLGSGTGVLGVSGSGMGVAGLSESAAGVEGKSKTGAGLHGMSSTNRGAVLESGENVAQMRLVPQKQQLQGNVRLPRRGKVGDLILIQFPGIALIDGPTSDVCGLWLCVPTSKRPRGGSRDDSNLWREVMLGDIIVGTV